MNKAPDYDVLIVGGGVVGTALLYTLSKYTDIKNIGLIEKYSDFGLVNSASYNNSQTLHFGDIETNYSIDKAKSVKRMADMVMKYLESEKLAGTRLKLFSKYSKMVLAVGRNQVEDLRKRYPAFSELFPHLRMIEEMKLEKLNQGFLKAEILIRKSLPWLLKMAIPLILKDFVIHLSTMRSRKNPVFGYSS